MDSVAYRTLMKDYRISQQMIAEALCCAPSQICLALRGNKPGVFALMVERCGPTWLKENARDPVPPRPVLAPFDEAKIDLAKRTVMDVPLGKEVSEYIRSIIYQQTVRSCHSYVVYHYFGLIANVDRLIDEGEQEPLCVDHVMSIVDGCRQGVPYWMVAAPVNLSVITASENSTKRCRSDLTVGEIQTRFEGFIKQFPRYWIVLSQSLNRIGIPKPFNETERQVSQRNYRSRQSKKTFVDTHEHRWGNSDQEFTMTINIDDFLRNQEFGGKLSTTETGDLLDGFDR